jgi:phage-related protein
LCNKKQYGLFAFWDKTDKKVTIVIATHGIVKKTKKTPKKEIEKATELMKKYFEYKNKKK